MAAEADGRLDQNAAAADAQTRSHPAIRAGPESERRLHQDRAGAAISVSAPTKPLFYVLLWGAALLALLAAGRPALLAYGQPPATLAGQRTLAPGPFAPNWESLKQYRCPQWFQDAKFGIWAHWSPQCVPEQGDWYARNMYLQGSDQYNYHVAHYGHPSKFGYKDICNLWKAEHWDPDRLIRLYKRAGAKYRSEEHTSELQSRR